MKAKESAGEECTKVPYREAKIDLRKWNCWLVQAVFRDHLDVLPEIRRIDATDGFLADAGGFDDGETARRSFLDALPHTESGVRQLFATDVFCNWSPSNSDLPFYAQLHLTILASSTDEQLQDIGNFRWRLAQMLGLPTEKDYVSAGCLPWLWEKAQQWSQWRFERYGDTRRLILPDPGYETIIGYAKGLAFPGFRDQTCLAEVLTDGRLDATSPLIRLRHSLQKRLQVFSPRFREEYSEFERRLDRGDWEGAQDTILWQTILETTWARAGGRSNSLRAGCRVEIDPIDPYDLGVWCYCRESADGGGGWTQDVMDRFDEMVTWRRTTDPSPGALFDWLRFKWNGFQYRSFIGDRLGRALAEGCVGFAQHEDGRWVDTSALPDAGTVWLILHRSNTELLEAPTGGDRGAVVYRAPLPGGADWILFGPIKVNESIRRWFEEHMSTLDFFAPRLARSRLTVVDSIRRADGASLYLPPIVPAFRCSGARTGMAVFDDGSSHELIPEDDRLTLSGSTWGDPRPNFECHVVAKDRSGKELARGCFRFADRSAALEFKVVRIPANWLESGMGGRLQPFSLDPSAIPDAEAEDHRASPRYGRRPLAATHATIGVPITTEIADVDERWWRTTEIFSAFFARRHAWPVGECAILLERLWGSWREGWARLDDLVENGVLRLLHARHWSNRVVVAGLPVVVLARRPNVIEVRIVGLLSEAMRALVETKLGGKGLVLTSSDRSTAGCFLHHVEGMGPLDALLTETGWPLLTREVMSGLTLPALDSVLMTSVRSDLDGYTEHEKRTWSPQLRVFLPKSNAIQDLPRLEHWPAPRLQALFVLHRRNGEIWNTDCRTWALLALASEMSSTFGEVLSDGTLHLKDPSLSLPRPLSWCTLAIGGGVCFRQADGTRTYPSGDFWAPSAACERWIENHPDASDGSRKALSARERYGFLLERKRMASRSSAIDFSMDTDVRRRR